MTKKLTATHVHEDSHDEENPSQHINSSVQTEIVPDSGHLPQRNTLTWDP